MQMTNQNEIYCGDRNSGFKKQGLFQTIFGGINTLNNF